MDKTLELPESTIDSFAKCRNKILEVLKKQPEQVSLEDALKQVRRICIYSWQVGKTGIKIQESSK